MSVYEVLQEWWWRANTGPSAATLASVVPSPLLGLSLTQDGLSLRLLSDNYQELVRLSTGLGSQSIS